MFKRTKLISGAWKFCALLSVIAFLTSCESHTQKIAEPLQFGPHEVAIDQNFKMFIISDRAVKLQALFFISIQNNPGERLICSALYYSPSKFIKDVQRVDFAGTNASLPFDENNSIIQPSERGEEFNFSYPDHKAKCQVKPPNYTLTINQPRLDIYTASLANGPPIPAKLGISMDLHTLKQIAMQ